MKLAIPLLSLFPFISTGLGQDYCSLVVKVVDPQQRRATARVTVEERDGRTEVKETEGGDLEFCDLGISPVTITVGHPACNQAVVRNVGLEWNRTTETTIIYDRAACLTDTPPVAACQILLRFRNPQQEALAKVTLELQTPHPWTLSSDKFGRELIRVVAGQRLRGQATAEGYRPATIDIDCSRDHTRFEQIVTFEKDPR
jgi:hypothetical protein